MTDKRTLAARRFGPVALLSLALIAILPLLPYSSVTARAIAEIRPATASFVEAVSYDLRLDLEPDRHMVSGEVLISLRKLPGYTGEIVLNLNRDMAATAVWTVPEGKKLEYSKKGDALSFNAGEAGTIGVSFYGDPSVYITAKHSFTYIGREGCYFDDLCYYFPRFGISGEALFEMDVRVPRGWTAISQGTHVATAPEVDGTHDRVTISNRRPSRCHTLAAGPYVEHSLASAASRSGYGISTFFFSSDSQAAPEHASEADMILEFYSARFGPMNSRNLKIVEIEKVFPGGYGPESVIYITASALGEVEGKKRVDAELLAHEIAHQWFGNLVNAEFPRSNFLNEAFATYASLQYLRQRSRRDFDLHAEETMRRYLAYRRAAGTDEVSIAEAAGGGRGAAYQEIMYYRGAFVLSTLLSAIESAGGPRGPDLIRGYVDKFRGRTAKIEDFIEYAAGRREDQSGAGKERGRIADIMFKDLYYGTKAIEISAGHAWVEMSPGVSGPPYRAHIALERHDPQETVFGSEIACYSAYGNIETFAVSLARGTFEVVLECRFLPGSWALDPERKLLITPVDAPEIGTSPVVIFGTQSPSRKVNAFMRELARNLSASPLSDENIDEMDMFSRKNLVLIGTPANNAALKHFSSFLPFEHNRYSLTRKGGAAWYDESCAARYTFRNPFIEKGAVTVIAVESEASIEHCAKVRSGEGDYAVFAPASSTLDRGYLRHGISGDFLVSGSTEKSQLKISSIVAGYSGNFIANAINPVFITISNEGGSTDEARITLRDDMRQGFAQVIRKEITVPPRSFNRACIFFQGGQGASKILFIELERRGAVVSRRTCNVNQSSSQYYFLAPGGSAETSRDMLSSALGDIFSREFRNAGVLEIASAQSAHFGDDPGAFSGVSALILNNASFGGADDGAVRNSLLRYAMRGGKVVISGYDLATASGPVNADFMKKLFATDLDGSRYIDFPPEQGTAEKIRIKAQRAAFTDASRTNSYGGKVASLFDGALLRASVGKGTFYYIPYDFTHPRIRRSSLNESVMKTAFVSKGRWPEPLIDLKEMSSIQAFREGESLPGLRIELFMVYMFIYIICLGPLLYMVLREKYSSDDYYPGMAVITGAFTFVIVVWGISITRFSTSVECITVAELPPGLSGGYIRNNCFSVAAGGSSDIDMSIPAAGFMSSSTPNNERARVNISGGDGGSVRVAVVNPLKFVSNVFAFSDSGGRIASGEHVSAEISLSKNRLKARVSSPHLASGGRYALIMKLPGAHLAMETEKADNEISASYSTLRPNDDAYYDISLGQLGTLGAAGRNAVKRIFRLIDGSPRYCAASFFIFAQADRTVVEIDGKSRPVDRLNIFVSPASFTLEPGAVIPPQFIFRERRSYSYDYYTDFTVDLGEYKRLAGEGLAGSLTCEFRLEPETASTVSQNLKALQNEFIRTLRVSLQDIEMTVAADCIVARVRNFDRHLKLDGADEGMTKFSLPELKSPFPKVKATATLYCE